LILNRSFQYVEMNFDILWNTKLQECCIREWDIKSNCFLFPGILRLYTKEILSLFINKIRWKLGVSGSGPRSSKRRTREPVVAGSGFLRERNSKEREPPHP
jgi:hypothetical protein